MKAAQADPPGEIIVEATVLLDRLILEAEGTQTYASRTPELREIYDRVIPEAIAQYLRRFPKARNNGHTYAQMPRVVDGVREIDFLCLVCRTSINTVSGKGGTLPQAFWINLQKHTDLCAVRFLIGQLEPLGPNNERAAKQTRIAVSKLNGKRLIDEAKSAAVYLGLPEIKARARGINGRIAGGRTTELRTLVSQARRVADARARDIAQLPTTGPLSDDEED